MADKNEMEMDELQDDLLLGSDDEEEIISDLDDDMILDEDTLKIAEAYLSDEEEEEDMDFGSEDEEEEAELDFEDRPKRRFYDDEEDVEVEDEINYFESRKPSHKLMLHEGRKPRHLRRLSEKYASFQSTIPYEETDVPSVDEMEWEGELETNSPRLPVRGVSNVYKDKEGNQYLRSYRTWVAKKDKSGKLSLIEPHDSGAWSHATHNHLNSFAKYAPTKRGLKGPRYNYDESFNRSKVRKSRMMKEAVRQARRNRKLQESRKMHSPFSKRRFR